MKKSIIILLALNLFILTTSFGQGVQLIKDLALGTENGIERDAEIIATFEDNIIFENDKSNRNDNKIFRSNGTEEGTYVAYDSVRVFDHVQSSDSVVYLACYNSDDYLLKFVNNEKYPTEVLKEWYSINNLTLFNGKVFFSGKESFQDEPYLFNYNPNTDKTTKLFKLTGSNPNSEIITFKDNLFLIAGYEDKTYLLKYDGISSIPEKVYYLSSGDFYISRDNMTAAGDFLYFWFKDDDETYNLYRTDGTTTGTIVLSNSFRNENIYSSNKNILHIAFNGKYYFNAVLSSDNKFDSDLYVSDGSVNGTKKIPIDNLPSLHSKAQYLTLLNNELYLKGQYSDASWYGYYGLLKLNDIETAIIETLVNDSISSNYSTYGENITIYQDSLAFIAGYDGNYSEIWLTDVDNLEYKSISKTYNNEKWSRPNQLTPVGNKLFFFALHPTYGYELFAYSPDFSSGYKKIYLEPKNISIYPNPTKNIIFFDINGTIKSITVYDILGKEIFNKTNYSKNNLNIEFLDKGLFFIKINTSENSYSGKFYKID